MKVELVRKKLQITLLFAGMLQEPLNYVQGDIRPAVDRFLKELTRIRKKFKVQPDVQVMERFQTRGHRSGPTIEIISAAYGARAKESLDKWPKAEFQAIMASQWKVAIKKVGIDLDAWYEQWCKPSLGRGVKNKKYVCPTHTLDAVLIGIYQAGRMHNPKNPFECLASKTDQKKFLDQVKKVYQKGVNVR